MLLAGAVIAQQPEPTPIIPLGRPGEKTLYIMVRAGAHLSAEQLKNTLTQGLNISQATIAGKPEIRQVSPFIFDELEALTSRTAKAVEGANAEHSVIRRLPLRDQGMWAFHLQSQSHVLKKLTITYRNAGKKEYVPVGPQEKGDVKLIVPGSYAVKLEANDDPVAYEAEVIEIDGNPQRLEGKWPALDRCYVVTMHNFRGDQNRLFTIIQDPRQVANPLDSVRLGSDLVFVFANMDSNAASVEGDHFSGNSLIVNVPGALNRNTARVWMLFPLTKQQAEDKLKELRAIKDELKISQVVRENAIHSGTEHVVGPETPARWLELPEHVTGRGFRRVIPLRDFKGLLEKYPAAYRLLVWEFDNGVTRAAIQVVHPDSKERGYVVDQILKEWPNAIKERIGSEPKK